MGHAWCASFWATVNLGGVLVGLNGWWKTDEIVYGLQDSGSKILVADDEAAQEDPPHEFGRDRDARPEPRFSRRPAPL